MKYAEMIDGISQNNSEPQWLKSLRIDALRIYEGLPGPSRLDEDWKRTDASKFLFSDLKPDCGKVSTPMIQPSDSSIIFCSLTEACKNVPDLVRAYLEESLDQNQKFVALNHALWNGGFFLYVPKNLNLELPLSPFPQGSIFPRFLVILDENSSVCLIEDGADAAGGEGWMQSFWDVHLKPSSRLSLVQTSKAPETTSSLLNFNANMDASSSLNLLSVNAGSALMKGNWNINLKGEGSSVKMYGLIKVGRKQHFDETIYVAHDSPNTQSDVLFKAALKDQARSIFSGLIHVKKSARKTDAHQTNRNLLLSKDARADSIPKLEIETDDVKCGHGASVSSLDEDQLYYMMVRGLTRKDAEEMIIDGFYEEVFGKWLGGTTLKDQESILPRLRGLLPDQRERIPNHV